MRSALCPAVPAAVSLGRAVTRLACPPSGATFLKSDAVALPSETAQRTAPPERCEPSAALAGAPHHTRCSKLNAQHSVIKAEVMHTVGKHLDDIVPGGIDRWLSFDFH